MSGLARGAAAAFGVSGGGRSLGAATQVAGILESVGKAVKSFGEEVVKAVNPLQSIGDSMARFVALASPADLNLFTAAVQDLNSVIGATLLPTFRLVTDSVRQAADVLHSLAPVGQTVAAALKPLFDIFAGVQGLIGRGLSHIADVVEQLAPSVLVLGEAFFDLFDAMRPLLELAIDSQARMWHLFAEAVVEVTPLVVALTRVLGDFITAVGDAVKELLSFLGIDLPGAPAREVKKGESVGAAVRGTSFGSVEDQLKKAMASAFSLGTGIDPAKDTAKEAKEIRSTADKIYDELRALPDKAVNWFKALPGEIAIELSDYFRFLAEVLKELGKIPGEAFDAARRGIEKVAPPPGVVKDALRAIPGGAAAVDLFERAVR